MKRNVLVLSLCQALMMTSNSLLVSTSALVGFALAADKSMATLPLALQFLSTMIVSIPASLVMRRIGRQYGFMLGALLGGAGACLATYGILNESFGQFCAGTMLFGAFNGFAIYYRFAAADGVTHEFKSKAISLVLAGGVLAAFAGPNLANWTRDMVNSHPFAGSFGSLVFVFAGTLVLLLFVSIPRPNVQERTGKGRPLGSVVKQPKFLVAALGAMLGYGVMSLVMTATPLAMQGHDHHFGDTAFVIQWHVFAMFAPSFFTGNLINRFGILNIMLVGTLMAASCVTVNLTGNSVTHFWLALVMLGIAWNFLFVGATTLLTETYLPEEKAKTQALNDFLVYTTITLSALSAGFLQHTFGWRIVNLGVLPAIGLILAAIFWLKLRRKVSVTATA